MRGRRHAAWEQKVFGPQLRFAKPGAYRVPRLLRDLKLHWMMGLLLHDGRPRCDPPALGDISDAKCHQVASAELAVDPQIE